MKIALIGGSGFVGTVLTPLLLNAGHDVVIGDIAPSESFPHLHRHADVTDIASLQSVCKGCDLIINLAAIHHDNVKPVSRYYDVNVTGAENLCRAADATGITHIVFTSSVAVYGFQEGAPDETAPHKPFNHYGITKSQAEDIYNNWYKNTGNCTLTIIRPTVVFGSKNRGNVYNLLRQIASGSFVMIGNGKNKKSMCYVENLAAFILHSLSFDKNLHIYNYVDKPDFDMNTLVSSVKNTIGRGDKIGVRLPYAMGIAAGAGFDTIAALTGKTFPVSRIRIQKFCANTVFTADKLEQTGFIAPYDLHTALEQTVTHEFGTDTKTQAAA